MLVEVTGGAPNVTSENFAFDTCKGYQLVRHAVGRPVLTFTWEMANKVQKYHGCNRSASRMACEYYVFQTLVGCDLTDDLLSKPGKKSSCTS